MPNILAATEALDIGLIEFYGISLTAVEPLDEAAFDIGTNPTYLEATEAPDVGAVDILTGEVITLVATEAKDIAAVTAFNEILTNVSAVEPLDEGAIDILTGTVGWLHGHERGDRGSVAFSADTLATFAGVEDTDYGEIFIREIPITYLRKAVVMHLFNYAVTEYKNYNFNSLLHFNRAFLGINEQGVYLLDGDDDLGELIQARIRSGLEDFAEKGAITIPREAWLAYRSNDGMLLDVNVDEDGDLPTMVFEKTAPGIRESREKLGRGIKGRFFTWDLKNASGSDFVLQSLRILGDIIKRKTR